jgi:hypothetical protein
VTTSGPSQRETLQAMQASCPRTVNAQNEQY